MEDFERWAPATEIPSGSQYWQQPGSREPHNSGQSGGASDYSQHDAFSQQPYYGFHGEGTSDYRDWRPAISFGEGSGSGVPPYSATQSVESSRGAQEVRRVEAAASREVSESYIRERIGDDAIYEKFIPDSARRRNTYFSSPMHMVDKLINFIQQGGKNSYITKTGKWRAEGPAYQKAAGEELICGYTRLDWIVAKVREATGVTLHN